FSRFGVGKHFVGQSPLPKMLRSTMHTAHCSNHLSFATRNLTSSRILCHCFLVQPESMGLHVRERLRRGSCSAQDRVDMTRITAARASESARPTIQST